MKRFLKEQFVYSPENESAKIGTCVILSFSLFLKLIPDLGEQPIGKSPVCVHPRADGQLLKQLNETSPRRTFREREELVMAAFLVA